MRMYARYFFDSEPLGPFKFWFQWFRKKSMSQHTKISEEFPC